MFLRPLLACNCFLIREKISNFRGTCLRANELTVRISIVAQSGIRAQLFLFSFACATDFEPQLTLFLAGVSVEGSGGASSVALGILSLSNSGGQIVFWNFC
jgi:hypothetical protein